MLSFIINHWAIIALILSEVLALIPSKYSGIAQIVYKIIVAIFGRKEKEAIKAQNSKFNK